MAASDVPALVGVFEHRVLPVVEKRQLERLLVAKPTMKEFLRANRPLPKGVAITPQPLRGSAVRVRRNLRQDEFEPVVARWPDDPLTATRAPMLICAVTGNADVRLGDYLLHLPEGQICLLPPEMPRTDGTESHTVGTSRANERCDLLWVRGNEGAVETWVCHSQGERHWIGSETRRVVIPFRDSMLLFSTLLREAELISRESQVITRGTLQVLLASLVRELQAGHYEAVSSYLPILSQSSPGWEPIEYAQRFITDNLNQHLTIESISRLVFMAPTQFTKRFREQTGQTFNHYVVQRRLEKAQALLRDTDWKVQFVAKNVGMNSSHLRRLFLQHAGRSPIEYRHEYRRSRSESNKPKVSEIH